MNRACGKCTECCTRIHVADYPENIDPEMKGKPAGIACPSLAPGGAGCGIYDIRPDSCRAFKCLWLHAGADIENAKVLTHDLRPDRSGVVLVTNQSIEDREVRDVIGLHVDPDRPGWRKNQKLMRFIRKLWTAGVDVAIIEGQRRIFVPGFKRSVPSKVTTAADRGDVEVERNLARILK